MHRIVFAAWVLLLAGAAWGGTQADRQVNLAGNWKLDYLKSTADLSNQDSNRLVITQMGDALRFDHYKDKKLVSTENIVADGKSRQRYRTRLETAFLKASWQKGALVMTIDSLLDNEGTQTYTTVDRWELSKDGNTLYKKSSDGKMMVFSREATPEAAPQ